MKATLGILSLLFFLNCVLTGINAANNSEYFDEKDLKTYLQPDDVGRNRKYDELNHNDPYLCTRDCKKHPKARLCYYIFNVEHYSTMGPACRNCSTGNITDCQRRQCIYADGFEKSVVSINRQIPGPTINVCYGDRIVVDVINKLATSALSIHWHGVLQKDTPWMDGVPYVTQCPIQPNSMFRYDFPADTNGTLFYHAHIAHLHANGVYGALIVRHANTPFDPNMEFHDYDLPSHTIHIADWNHLPAEALFPGFYKNESHIPEKHDLLLINGHGWYSDAKVTKNVSVAEFHVECGKRYRFRIIASTTSTCSFRFAVQDHTMSVVALDGYPCNRTDVNTLVMSSGQRTDVIIKPSKGDKNCQKESYLIVVKGMDTCENLANAQTANLIYHNTTNLPTWPPNLATIHNKPPYLNNHQLKCNHSDNVCADTLPPATGYAGFVFNDSSPVSHTFVVQPGFHNYALDELFETNTYNSFYVPFGPNGTFTAALNNVTGIVPPVPLLTQENDIPSNMRICHNSCNEGESFCRCINILEVGLNTIVEVQFQKSQFNIVHPIHLHGHHFTVVKPVAIDPTPFVYVGQVQRDTVHAPLDGLARIKFYANNPGYWIMHCHFSPHLEGGMFLVFKVGNSSSFKPPPTGFPKCGDFRSPIKKF